VAGEDDELVAAQPADGVPGPHLLGEALAHLAQQQVAELVAEGVVDGLEPVEVDDEQGGTEGIGDGAGERVADHVEQRRPVGQPGQLVVPGPPGHGLFLTHPLGDVDVRDHHPGRALDPGRLQAEPAGARTELGGVLVVEGDRRPVGLGAQPADPGDDRGVVRGPHGIAHARQVVVADAARPDARGAQALPVGHPRAVGGQDAVVPVDQDGRRRQRLEDGGQLADLGVPLLVGAVVGVDVTEEDGEARGVGEGTDLVPAVLRLVVVLELPWAAVGEHLAHVLLEGRPLGGREAVDRRPAQQFLGPVLEQRFGRGVQVGEPALVIQAVHGVGNAGQEVQWTVPGHVVGRSHAARSRPLSVPRRGGYDGTDPTVVDDGGR
jgi:hypothetical protein